MLLMWTSTLRGRSSAGERLQRAAGARERDVAHVVRAAVGDAEQGELVLAPERPVDEHEVARGEAGQDAVVERGERGRVGEHAAARAVADHEPAGLVVARLERLDDEARPVDGQRAPRLQRPPVDAAEALQHAHDRVARGPARRAAAPKTRTGAPDSRRRSRPAVWSISASVSSTPATGGARTASTWSGVSVSSCWRASGEALTRNHGPSSPRIASDDCMRGRARTPSRAASHVPQWQFHCGNPPPAAEPRTRTRTWPGVQAVTGGTGRR